MAVGTSVGTFTTGVAVPLPVMGVAVAPTVSPAVSPVPQAVAITITINKSIYAITGALLFR
jgi:hypothetical protein